MPRSNSSDWSNNEAITWERMQDINQDIDDIYENWNDRLRVVEAISWTPLKIDIGAGVANVWWTEVLYAWWTDIAVTDDATNYVQIDNTWTIQIATDTRNTDYTNLAKVTCASWAITDIELRKPDAVWWPIGWTNALTIWFVIEYWENVTLESWEIKAWYAHTDGKAYLSDMNWTTNEDKVDFVFIESWSSGDFKTVISAGAVDRDWTAWDDLRQNNNKNQTFTWHKNTQGSSKDLMYDYDFTTQAIRPTIDMTVSQVLVSVCRESWSTPSFSVRIETDDWSWDPSWTLVHANATVSWSATSFSSLANVTLTFPGSFSLSADTTYHVVINHTSIIGGWRIMAVWYHSSVAFDNAPEQRINTSWNPDWYLNFRLIDSSSSVVDYETDSLPVDTLWNINSTKPWVWDNNMVWKQITSTVALITALNCMYDRLNV